MWQRKLLLLLIIAIRPSGHGQNRQHIITDQVSLIRAVAHHSRNPTQAKTIWQYAGILSPYQRKLVTPFANSVIHRLSFWLFLWWGSVSASHWIPTDRSRNKQGWLMTRKGWISSDHLVRLRHWTGTIDIFPQSTSWLAVTLCGRCWLVGVFQQKAAYCVCLLNLQVLPGPSVVKMPFETIDGLKYISYSKESVKNSS